MEKVIQIEKLTKNFGKHRGIENITFEVSREKFEEYVNNGLMFNLWFSWTKRCRKNNYDSTSYELY